MTHSRLTKRPVCMWVCVVRVAWGTPRRCFGGAAQDVLLEALQSDAAVWGEYHAALRDSASVGVEGYAELLEELEALMRAAEGYPGDR